MNSFEPKKLALIRIYQILQRYSDEKHPMTQEKIAEFLEREYGIEIERKAIGRNLGSGHHRRIIYEDFGCGRRSFACQGHSV